MIVYKVRLTVQAKKDLKKIPHYIRDNLNTWIRSIQREGIMETRKIRGYHDELLKGKRKRQRSIRLSRSYRAIYQESNDGSLNIISIMEISKHEY